SRHRAARHAADAPIPRWLCRSCQIRVDRRCRLLRLAGGELAGAVCRRAPARAPPRGGRPPEGPGRRARPAPRRRAGAASTLPDPGPTLGPAPEARAGFSDRLLHGEAIALGMTLAFAFSAKRGLLPVAEAERVERHLAAVGLPLHVSSVPGGLPGADRLMELIAQDKKGKRAQLPFLLPPGIRPSSPPRHPQPTPLPP